MAFHQAAILPLNGSDYLQSTDVSTPEGYALYRRLLLRYVAKGKTGDFVKPAFLTATTHRRNDQILSNLTSAAATSPADTNVLRRLPAELMLLVAECLDTVDFMSFRATCRWHCDLAESITQKSTRRHSPRSSTLSYRPQHIARRLHCVLWSALRTGY
jgi:hypothetical protein